MVLCVRPMKSNTIDISLLEFIKTGRFGPVSLGMSRHDVFALFGKPDVVGAGNLETRLCKYGDIEFHFQAKTGLLYLIWSDHIPFPGERSRRIRLDPWLFNGNRRPSKDAIGKGLTEHGVNFQYREIESETVPGLTILPPDENEVLGYLSEEPSGEFLLESGVAIGIGDIIAHHGNDPLRLVEKNVAICIGAFDETLSSDPEK